MARDYKPVSVKAIPWARVYKHIREHGAAGVAVYDLADELDVERGHPPLEKALTLLLLQGRVRVSVGRSKSGMTCRVVQAVDTY